MKVIVTGHMAGFGKMIFNVLRQDEGIELVGIDVASANPVDVASVDQVVNALSDHGDALVLINAAGTDPQWPSHKAGALHHHAHAVRVNLGGTMNTCAVMYPLMRDKGRGLIINLLSEFDGKEVFGYAGYCASKAGVKSYSATLDMEGSSSGVRCIAVEPIDSNINFIVDAIKIAMAGEGK